MMLSVLLLSLLCGCGNPGAQREEAELLGGRYGRDSRKVTQIQLLLMHEGHHAGEVDGLLESNTRDAVERFQAAHGIPRSGYVDRATWLAMTALRDDEEAPSSVKQVQYALFLAGLNLGSIDGVWGWRTEDALREFQKRHELEQTGTIDDETWEALKPFVNE
ncbi:MAG: peptidoglycan-binding domain-containing protein [Elusimicrobiota bacterium]